MELHQKLQELRRQKGLTQEELAKSLYVSRTAISKWESGRGVPNVESLKAIAQYFSITVDELLSSDELLTLAEENQKQVETHARDLVFGLVDLCAVLFLFLPLFGERTYGVIGIHSSLFGLATVQPYLKIAYFAVVIAMMLIGVLTLALQNCKALPWVKSKTPLSLAGGVLAVFLFMISSQPYAAIFAFALLAIKAVMLIKRS